MIKDPELREMYEAVKGVTFVSSQEDPIRTLEAAVCLLLRAVDKLFQERKVP